MSDLKGTLEKVLGQMYGAEQDLPQLTELAGKVCDWYAHGGTDAVEEGLKRRAKTLEGDFEKSLATARGLVDSA